MECEWLDRLPRFRLLKEPQGRVRYLKREEAGRLLKELPEHLCAMARLSLATGLRQGNVKGLRWSNVDLERRSAWVDASEAKGKRAIPVPLNADAMEVIEGQRGDGIRNGYLRTGVGPSSSRPARRRGGGR